MLGLALLLLLLVLALLRHRFRHQLLERHVDAFFFGISLGLPMSAWVVEDGHVGNAYLGVDVTRKNQGVSALYPLAHRDLLVAQHLVADIPQHALDLKLTAS